MFKYRHNYIHGRLLMLINIHTRINCCLNETFDPFEVLAFYDNAAVNPSYSLQSEEKETFFDIK